MKLRFDLRSGKSFGDHLLSATADPEALVGIVLEAKHGIGHRIDITGRDPDASLVGPLGRTPHVGDNHRGPLGQSLYSENSEGLLPDGRKKKGPTRPQLDPQCRRAETGQELRDRRNR